MSNFYILPKTKIKCQSDCFTAMFLLHIQKVLPIVKSISLNIYIDLPNETFFRYLLEDWWPLTKTAGKIHMNLRIANKARETNLTEHQKKKLLSEVNQLNEQYQVQWIETDRPIYPFIAEIHSKT